MDNTAKDFIRSLLTLDDKKRLTAKQALKHKWMTSNDINEIDILETVRANFNPKRTLKSAVGAIRAMNRLKLATSPSADDKSISLLAKTLAEQKLKQDDKEATPPTVTAV